MNQPSGPKPDKSLNRARYALVKPEGLSSELSLKWDHVIAQVPPNFFNAADADLLYQYCHQLVRIDKMRNFCEKEGYTQLNMTTMRTMERAESTLLTKTEKAARDTAKALGLILDPKNRKMEKPQGGSLLQLVKERDGVSS